MSARCHVSCGVTTMAKIRISTNAGDTRLKVLAGLMVVPILFAFIALLAHLNGQVRSVRIEGRLTGAEQAAVERAVAPVLDSGFLWIDMGEVVDAILALSWPRRVSARRDWPFGLHIVVDKETLVARWGNNRALNSAGQIIDTLETVPAGLPLIACEEADGERALSVLEMLERPVRENRKTNIINVQPGDHTDRNYAIAVDIGTTTIYGQLIDLITGDVLAENGDFNAQISFGEDVISRIAYRFSEVAVDSVDAARIIWRASEQPCRASNVPNRVRSHESRCEAEKHVIFDQCSSLILLLLCQLKSQDDLSFQFSCGA